MQSQVGLPLVFQYNTNNNNTTQSHHHNVTPLFGGGQKASYFTSNGAQQQQQQYQYGDTSSFSSLSSQVKVQPPLSSYTSMGMSTSSTHSSSNKNDANINVNGMMMTPAEHYQQSMQGYESFR